MGRLFARSIAGVVALLVGGALGYYVGVPLGDAPLGAVGGAAVGVFALGVRDAWHATRLVEGLRGAQTEAAPREPG
ncbi:MAG TPA: PAS domain-containing sensor histidine kinase, partial [Ideonella sp.]|nr:PAS domain-containing sensor histidine kinase [Ideonella sp.]